MFVLRCCCFFNVVFSNFLLILNLKSCSAFSRTVRHCLSFRTRDLTVNLLIKFQIFAFYFNFLYSISILCTQFQHSTLNFNFLHCLGLIDVFSAIEDAETFACVLLQIEMDSFFSQSEERNFLVILLIT